jgi:hypothetical protein
LVTHHEILLLITTNKCSLNFEKSIYNHFEKTKFVGMNDPQNVSSNENNEINQIGNEGVSSSVSTQQTEDAWFAVFLMEQIQKANDQTAWFLKKHPEWIYKASASKLLIEAQNEDGSFRYDCVPLSRATREQLVTELQFLRKVWETLTSRNQDLSDEHLNDLNKDELKNTLNWYYSDHAKAIMLQHVVRGLIHLKKQRLDRREVDSRLASESDEDSE